MNLTGFADSYSRTPQRPPSKLKAIVVVCVCVTMSDNGEVEYPEKYFTWPKDDGTYEKWTHSFTGAFTRTKDGCFLVFMKDWTGKVMFKLTEGQYRDATTKMQTVIDTLTAELTALLLRVIPTADPTWTFDHQIHHMWHCTSVDQPTQDEVWHLYFDKLRMLQSSLDDFKPSSSKYE